MSADPARVAIREAIDQCKRYDVPLVPDKIFTNVDLDELSMGYVREATARRVRALIPVVLKEDGHVIVDTVTRERKELNKITLEEWQEQLQIRRESSTYDRARLRADFKLAELWAEKNKEFGYPVYVEMFWDEACRLYKMEGVQPPSLAALNGVGAS